MWICLFEKCYLKIHLEDEPDRELKWHSPDWAASLLAQSSALLDSLIPRLHESLRGLG